MGQALYRKYRPKKLTDIVGQEHITLTLSNALTSDRISHAYLFTGPRGVGKTSVARILAHEINGFDYSEDNSYIDIIEIDAASNRRIDEIRQLRDRVNTAPSRGKYKVYIIDEVHMLTREAFNALLKTLEEPPAHAVFILATTEAHKVPETIVSRTQQFNFRPISPSQILSQLKSISKKEKIDIEDGALSMIAEHVDGSDRDGLSLLDQVSSVKGKITEEDLRELLGMAPAKLINELVISIESGSLTSLVSTLKQVDDNGYNITVVCKQLIDRLKEMFLNNESKLDPESLLSLIKQVVDVPSSVDSSTLLEIILLEATLKQVDPTLSVKPITNLSEDAKIEITEKVVEETIKEEIKENPITEVSEDKPKPARSKNKPFDEKVWQEVLNVVKKKYNTLYGILRMAVPSINDDELVLTTRFEFHKKLLSDTKNQDLILSIIEELTGKHIKIKAAVDKEIEPPASSEALVGISESITTINDIFGTSEVVE